MLLKFSANCNYCQTQTCYHYENHTYHNDTIFPKNTAKLPPPSLIGQLLTPEVFWDSPWTPRRSLTLDLWLQAHPNQGCLSAEVSDYVYSPTNKDNQCPICEDLSDKCRHLANDRVLALYKQLLSYSGYFISRIPQVWKLSYSEKRKPDRYQRPGSLVKLSTPTALFEHGAGYALEGKVICMEKSYSKYDRYSRVATPENLIDLPFNPNLSLDLSAQLKTSNCFGRLSNG